MLCEKSKSCSYYNTYRYKSSANQYQLLVESYCEGSLQTMCRRQQYRKELSEEVPEDLAPNGYLIGTHKKIRVVNLRKHERYEVEGGVCLIQDPSSKKIFSADVMNVSKGGLKLKAQIDPHDFSKESLPTILKILGHTIAESPFPLTEEFVKIVWSDKQVVGCSFVISSA
jgi:hypothetical protein